MREIIARMVCGLTLVIVIALSLVFASMHNHNPAQPGEAPEPMAGSETIADPMSRALSIPLKGGEVVPPSAAGAAKNERGRAMYEQHNCATCHAIAGEGNPRNPLDGVGTLWNDKEMADWITGSGSAADALPAAIVKRKQRYQAMPRADLDALVAYLKSLQKKRESRQNRNNVKDDTQRGAASDGPKFSHRTDP